MMAISGFMEDYIINTVRQYFSTAGPWPQLYRSARDSPGIDN